MNLEKEIKKIEEKLEIVIKENCKEKTKEELIEKICKLTKENIELKSKNMAILTQLFLKGDNKDEI